MDRKLLDNICMNPEKPLPPLKVTYFALMVWKWERRQQVQVFAHIFSLKTIDNIAGYNLVIFIKTGHQHVQDTQKTTEDIFLWFLDLTGSEYHFTETTNHYHSNIISQPEKISFIKMSLFSGIFYSNFVHFAAISITVATQANIFNLDLMRFYW